MNQVASIVILMSVLCPSLYAQTPWQMQPTTIQIRWAKQVTPKKTLPKYPRPQMVRSKRTNLNGLWNYAVTAKDVTEPTDFDGQILVLYPIESALSGVKKALLYAAIPQFFKHLSRPAIFLSLV